MIKNYLKIALRNMGKRRGYVVINVVGLSVGLACCLLIALYVRYEYSYDRFHEDADRIHRINWISGNSQTRTPHPMAQALAADFPEVVSAVSLTPIWGPGLTRPAFSVSYGDRRFSEREVLAVDSTFLDVFSFPVVEGDAREALREPFYLLLTASAAEKYFGTEDPIGRILRVNDELDLTVGAVLADVPPNSHFHFDFLLSYVTMKQMSPGSSFFEWGDFGHYNYVRLADGVSASALEAKLIDWLPRYTDLSEEAVQAMRTRQAYFQLQPITDIHLHSHLRWELEPNSDIAYIYSLTAAAVFLLLIACVNFMNLATARSMDRAREVGMRKALGAARLQIVGQFIGESLIMSTLGMAAALALVEVLLPAFNRLAGTALRIPYTEDLWIFAAVVVLTLSVGVLAGSYPALYLSAFRPAGALKGLVAKRSGGLRMRQSLVVFQFTLSLVLLVGTLVIVRQVSYLRNAPLGFDGDQVVVVPLPDGSIRDQIEAFKEDIVRHPDVLHAGAASNVPGGSFNQNAIRWAGDEGTLDASEWYVDYDLLETLGMEIVQGRGFGRDFRGDVGTSFLLNETAAQRFAWDSPVDQELTWYADPDSIRGTVVGVVKDFHFASLQQPVAPIIMQLREGGFNYLLVKIRAVRVPETLAFLKERFAAFAPARSFTYSFLDDDFDALYRSEARMGSIIGAFALLAVFVACLGLLALAAFSAEQRTKEIGVRKVLGATTGQIIVLMTTSFARLVLVALVVSVPLAYLAVSRWLDGFAYRMDFRGIEFVVAGALVLLVAVLTVSYQAVKAALADPVRSLRYE